MKKWLFLLISIIIIGIGSIYLFIPRNIVISKSMIINANQEGVFRYLRTDSNWQKWWPEETIKNPDGKTIFTFNDHSFSLKKVQHNSFEFNVERNKDTIVSVLYLLPVQLDSFKLQWGTNINTSVNPITKIQRYFLKKDLEKAFEDLLSKMADHFTKTKNIYGLDIKPEKVQFQHFITTKKTFTRFPVTTDVYTMISQIREYITETDAKEENQPILNISTKDSIHFETQVAIPVNKDLPGNNVFASKWMLKGGNILVAEINGDINEINLGFKKMEKYISDYHRTIIAIPFQMLITDRMKEPDSTKWITRLYYPVM